MRMLANNPTCLVVELPQKCNISVRGEYESIGMMVMMVMMVMMMMMVVVVVRMIMRKMKWIMTRWRMMM